MFKKALLSSAIFLFSPALAVADGYTWDGFYAGIHAGWGQGDVGWIDNNGGWFTFIPGYAHSANGDGLVGGGQVGYLKQWDNMVVGGIEISASGLDTKTTVTSLLFPGSDTWSTEVNALVTATARLGYAMGNILPYIEGGYAGGNVNMTNIDSVFCGALQCIFDSDEWHNGYTLGVGVDYRITKNVVAGLNYRFADLGSSTHAGITLNNGTVENYTVDAEVHAVTFRLNWLFNSNGN